MKESDFWSTSEGIKLEKSLHHDDFNVVNPFGNKNSKYKVSTFYFVLGNLPAKYKSRLTEIHLVDLTQAKVITKYEYENVLGPLINDLIVLEIQGLKVVFEGKTIHFQGSLSMVACDSLAAHTLRGYFCNFSSLWRFYRFCNYTKDQIQEAIPSLNFTLRRNQGYDNIYSNSSKPLPSLWYEIYISCS